MLLTPAEREEDELPPLDVTAEREEREEELLTPLTPPPLVGREALGLMVVPLRVPDSSFLWVGLAISERVVPTFSGTLPLDTAGRAEEPPREDVALPLVPPAICVPPREVDTPPNCSLYDGREVLPPAVTP